MFGQGKTHYGIYHNVRAARQMAETLRAEAANGDPSVAMKPSPRTPRTRVKKPKAKATSASKKSGQDTHDTTAENTPTITRETDFDNKIKIEIEDAIKIDSDSDDDIIVKIKDENPFFEDLFAAATAHLSKSFGVPNEQRNLDIDHETFETFEDTEERDGDLDVAPKWPVQSWFKDEDEA